jgi:hypothetical protein
MTRHKSEGQSDKYGLPEENVNVIGSSSATDTFHVSNCQDGAFSTDSSHECILNSDESSVATGLQAKPVIFQKIYFSSISNCQISDVILETIPSDNLTSVENVKLDKIHRKWDWLLFFIVIFAVVSSYALIWAKGLGIIELSKSDLKIYFAGWLSQMMALVFHRLRRSRKSIYSAVKGD